MLLTIPALCASDQPYELSGNIFYFPSIAASNDLHQSWLKVTVNATSSNWQFNQIGVSGDTEQRTTGTVSLSQGTSYTMTVNGTTYTVFGINIGTVTGGQVQTYNASTGTWATVTSHSNNLVSNFQQQYIDWIFAMRGEGYPISPFTVAAMKWWLDGVAPTEQGEWSAGGGTPGVEGSNPTGGSSTSTTTGSTTSTNTSGNATVTSTLTTNITYTYNTTNNNTTNNNGSDVDLGPLVSAVNGTTSAVTALGAKVDDTNETLDDLMDAVITGDATLADLLQELIDNGVGGGGGGTTPGPVAGIDPGESPDAAAAADSAAGIGADAAASKFGSLAGIMSISGQTGYELSLAIPWIDGETQTYTVNSLPESGSPLDQFRILLRVLFAVMIGLGFIYTCVKTLRFY